MSIGERIKIYRIAKNLTQKQLAEKASIAEITVRQYENGVRTPRIGQMINLAVALEVPIDNLMGDDLDLRIVKLPDNSSELHAGDLDSKERFENDGEKSLIKEYRKLNEIGKSKAIEQVEMLTKISEYQKKEE